MLTGVAVAATALLLPSASVRYGSEDPTFHDEVTAYAAAEQARHPARGHPWGSRAPESIAQSVEPAAG